MVGFFGAGNEEVISVRTVFTVDKKTQKKTQQSVTTTAKNMGNGMEEVVKKVGRGGKIISRELRKSQEQFSMWALSFIFAGMQIKAVSEQITRATVATFLKIEKGQTDAGRALIGLGANFKFLQFQIGQAIGTALKPLMPILTSIIRSVAQFVQLNPGKTFAAIGAAFVLGTGMFLGGQMVLFADAVVSLVGKAGGLAGVASSLQSMAVSAGKLVGVGIGFYYAYETLKDIDEDTLTKTLGEALFSVAGFSLAMGKSKQAGAFAVVGIGMKIMGDSDFRESFAGILVKLSRLVYAAITAWADAMGDWFKRIGERFVNLGKIIQGVFTLDWGMIKSNASALIKSSLTDAGGVSTFTSNFRKRFNQFDEEGAMKGIKTILDAPSNLLDTGSIYGRPDFNMTPEQVQNVYYANVLNMGQNGSSGFNTGINPINRVT